MAGPQPDRRHLMSYSIIFKRFFNFTMMPGVMKKYQSIGELLIDYRKVKQLSQADFAASINVDTRTIQRWENGSTLIKPEKEESIVVETLLPYQLIRNLNASKPIPTYYDFHIRKYSLTKLAKKLPKASWFKANIDVATNRIRSLDYDQDIDDLVRYMSLHKKISRSLKAVIKESIKLIPELNLIIFDDSGYYSGHSLVFPVNEEAYMRLRNREMTEQELRVSDLVDYRTLDRPIFFSLDITADCNDNIYFIVGQMFRFIRDQLNGDYLFCSIPFRYDNFEVNADIGLHIVWEDDRYKNEFGLEMASRFQEGNFKKMLME